MSIKRKKKLHRKILAVGYPWFLEWDNEAAGDTIMLLMSGPNRVEGRKRVALKYRNKEGASVVGAWQKVKVILEW